MNESRSRFLKSDNVLSTGGKYYLHLWLFGGLHILTLSAVESDTHHAYYQIRMAGPDVGNVEVFILNNYAK